MTHELSSRGASFIKHFEGERLTAYDDGTGIMTIGYGHTGDVKAGETITQAQADSYLMGDVKWAVDTVNNAVKVKLQQNQFDALVSFTFNVGEGAFKSSTLLQKLNAGDYAAVPGELDRWIYAGDKKGAFAEFARWSHLGSGKEVSPVLKGRREKEGMLFSKGTYG
ncbi:lysozyme [uncultured Sneathiella sp.]|uniref:lysozyme n=1 Tax=uncultured Sneathiella sp. TaxID=879315 RepID=UPI0030ECD8B9|tara:strand:- start:68714 stop:69211 length:498 start_codon:yes stop_codon:yes gene_type:complete